MTTETDARITRQTIWKDSLVIARGLDGGRMAAVSVEIRNRNGKPELSISGVIGHPNALRKGNADTCGQCIDAIDEIPADKLVNGWTADDLSTLVGLWRAWHLNGMRAGCQHQRAAGWNRRPIDPSKPLDTYGRHFAGQRSASWNMLTWIRPDEHPEGLLTKPCGICGYGYGTAWLHEDLPTDVMEWLHERGIVE